MSRRYTADAAREYSEALGMIGAGWWRQVAWAQQQGIPEALGLDTKGWVQEFVGGWVKLPLPDRRAAVLELTTPAEAGGMGLSQRAAADVLGVSEATVRRDASNDALKPELQREPASNDAPPHEYEEETPIDIGQWRELVAVITAIEQLTNADASDVAAAIPNRRRVATAKRLRKLGSYLGRIAWLIETKETERDTRDDGIPGASEAVQGQA